MMLVFFLGLLAEAYEHAGRPADARSTLENALGGTASAVLVAGASIPFGR